MKKQITNISPSDKVLNSLTGYVAADKKTLISAIHNFRDNNVDSAECEKLGKKLYEILLENGLNESDIINPLRLWGKLDGFVYGDKPETAIEILEVLDAIEFYQKHDPNGNPAFYVNNEVEAKILVNNYRNPKIKNISWMQSARPIYLNALTNISLAIGNIKEAKYYNQKALELNPFQFEANLLAVRIEKKGKARKIKEGLLKCWKFTYNRPQLAEFFRELSEFYKEKNDLTTAYAVLAMRLAVDDYEIALQDLNDLKHEIEKMVVSPHFVPSLDECFKILEKENIKYNIPAENFGILLDLYEEYYKKDKSNKILEGLKEIILDFAKDPEILTKIHQKHKKNKKGE